ncbi:MAG TPA: polysaccharide deacetylase family protein [Candidatus Saccharimonadales bacterium]|nr:polysaccharide deacetylase family protein [Candidatus Saccharimonadales bacterium]
MEHKNYKNNEPVQLTVYKKITRRRLLIAAIIILAIVAVVVGVVLYKNHQNHKVKETSSTQKTKFSNITFDTTVEWNNDYRMNVMYPVTGQKQLDAAARAKIDDYVTDFRKQVASKPRGSAPYELNILGMVNYASKEAINFEYTGKWVINGKKGDITINALFDRVTGKEIQTSDLFKDSAYLQTASDTARKELPGILGTMNYNQSLVEAGTTPTAAHFDQFEIVDSNTINIIFEPGQVADISLGIIKAPLAINSLNGDLNDAIVGKIFPDYIAQVQAAAQKAAAEKAAADAAAKKAAAGQGAQPLVNGSNTDCTKVKCVALTFDDGPGPGTATILDTLKQYKAHGTFMVVGSRVASYASLVQREAAEGHDIGNHTWDHADLTNMSLADAQSEVNRTAQAVTNVVGKRPFFVRPPYGSYNQAVVNAVGEPFILWSVDPDDWKDRDANIVYQRVMSAVKPGAIVLSHDLYPTTAAAYQRIIPDLIQQGYTLVTVSDLLNLDPANPGTGVYIQQQ